MVLHCVKETVLPRVVEVGEHVVRPPGFITIARVVTIVEQSETNVGPVNFLAHGVSP
jgi:hypothetical protein